MISHKNLIILTVLFEITIFSNGEKTTEEIKQCKKHLEIMGFNLESGFYNYNYVLQFENVEKLINHVKTRITVENGTIKPVPKQTAIVNDVTLPGTIGHLHTIYKKINDARDTELEEIIMTPNQFCTFYYEHREKILQNRIDEERAKIIQDHIGGKNEERTKTIQDHLDKKRAKIIYDILVLQNHLDEKNEKKAKISKQKLDKLNELKEKTPDLVNECTRSILDFKYDKDGPVFKYDENNRYKNIITSYDLSSFYNKKKGGSLFEKLKAEVKVDIKGIEKAMSEPVMEYFMDHILIIKVVFCTSFPQFEVEKLCDPSKNTIINKTIDIVPNVHDRSTSP